MSAVARDHPSPDEEELRRQYEVTRDDGLRHRSDVNFMDRVRQAVSNLDDRPAAVLMTQAEFLERYPTKG